MFKVYVFRTPLLLRKFLFNFSRVTPLGKKNKVTVHGAHKSPIGGPAYRLMSILSGGRLRL